MDRQKIDSIRAKFQDRVHHDFAPFWLEHGFDHENGGVYTCLARDGSVYSTDKSGWGQGRCAWIFSYICNTYGKNEKYLEFAKSCLEFLKKYGADSDGRMYFLIAGDGRPLRKRRYYFTECFYAIGCAEYAVASGEKEWLLEARRVYDQILRLYREPSSDPYKITPKVIPETRMTRAMGGPMIMINVTSVMRRCDPERRTFYDGVAREMIGDVIKYHYKPDLGCCLENVGMNGEFMERTNEGRIVNPGHSIEAAWFMLDEAIALNDDNIRQTGLKILNQTMELGWDKEYGGITYFVDIQGKPCINIEKDLKLWWPMNESIIALLMAYEVTGDARYEKLFDEYCDYAFNGFADTAYGDWVGYLSKEGKWQLPATKGNYFKGPFHYPRMLVACDTVLARMQQR